MIKRLILPFLICYSFLLSAQEIKNLSLQEAVELAKQNSLASISAKNRYKTSYWQYKLYNAGLLPSLDLNATLPNFSRRIIPVIQPDGNELFVSQSQAKTAAGLSLSQALNWTGGEVFISTGLQRIDIFGETDYTSYLSTPVTIGLSQPIFAHNPWKWQKKIEPMFYDEAKKAYAENMEDVAMQAVDYFFDVYLSRINYEIAKNNVANNDTLYKITEGRYNLGKIGENDLLQMELVLLNARSAMAQAALEMQVSEYRLKRYLGLEENVSVDLIVPLEIPDFNVDISKALQFALKNRSKIVQLDRNLLEAERDLNKAKLDNAFQANLYAAFGLENSAADFGAAYKDPQDYQQVVVGLQVPIMDWGKGRARMEIAKSNMELVRNTVEQDEINFEQEVFLQVSQFILQRDQLKIAAKADTVAQKRYEVAKYRFISGRIDITDLNIASNEKDIAIRNNIRNLRDFWLQYYNLRKLTLYDFNRNEPLSVE